MTKFIKSISLFANDGIGEYYIQSVGIKNVIANELLGERCRWYKSIYPHCSVIPGSIENPKIFYKLVKLANKERIELLTGSPPCQNITVANGNKDKGANPTNHLIVTTIDLIKEIKTLKYILLENAANWFKFKPSAIPELKGRNIKEYLIDELTACGFKYIHARILNAADYGTPQNRKRSILIASKEEDWILPEKEKRISLKEAIFDLESLESGEYSETDPWHYAPVWNETLVNIMRHTPTGCSAWENKNPKYRPFKKDGTAAKEYRSAYSRNKANEPCCSILMKSTSNGGMKTCHPGRYIGKDDNGDDIYSDARAFTIRELLIICGLPSDYPIPDFAINNDQLIRDILGECFAPQLVKRLLAKIPRTTPFCNPKKGLNHE